MRSLGDDELRMLPVDNGACGDGGSQVPFHEVGELVERNVEVARAFGFETFHDEDRVDVYKRQE